LAFLGTDWEASLHGLVRHMAEVECNWFRRVLLSEPDLPPLFGGPDARGGDAALYPLDDADLIREMVDGAVGW
jgi:hypothetical protein